jgi:hypothetical protein
MSERLHDTAAAKQLEHFEDGASKTADTDSGKGVSVQEVEKGT